MSLRLPGTPPKKTFGRSMRNVSSSQREGFMALRQAAIAEMAGRKWYEASVAIDLRYQAPSPPSLLDQRYLDGVMDTLGGSHGPTFIYLPIVYLDDCQVASARVAVEIAPIACYEIEIDFL